MRTGVDLVRDIVRSQLPAYRAASIRPLGEGEDHVAYEVDGRLVVRLGRDERPGACAPRTERELALLDVVARIATLPVPRASFAVPERCCYGYARLDGVPVLSLAPRLRARHASAVAASLGELLAALHATPVAEVAELAPTDLRPATEWLREAADQYAGVAGHVPAAHDRAIRAFLDTAPPETRDPPVFSHNDLGIEHVLVDPDTGRVTGVERRGDLRPCPRLRTGAARPRAGGAAGGARAFRARRPGCDRARVVPRAVRGRRGPRLRHRHVSRRVLEQEPRRPGLALLRLARAVAHSSGRTSTRCPSAQTMNHGPGRQRRSSSQCHWVSTRCTDAPHSWHGGEARATRSALVMTSSPPARGPTGLS
jgi:phosphotransferase family enzyme